MLFLRGQRRDYWVNAALGIIPDSIIAMGITYYLDLVFWDFVFWYLGFQCLYIIIWFKQTVWRWVTFKPRIRPVLLEQFRGYLKTNNFPVMDDFEYSAEDYLQRIISDDSLNVSIRLCASRTIGFLDYTIRAAKLQENLMFNMVLEEAIKKHSEELKNN